ncbi:MAG: Hpt domain-containing protein, partial [Nitrospirota bacterium]
MSSEFDRQGLVGIFVTEASEAMDMLTKALHPLDGTTPTPIQLQEQYVCAHKIRGASALYGFEGLALMATLIESILEEAQSIEDSHWPKALETLRGMVNSFQSQLEVIATGGTEDSSISARWKDEVSGLLPVLSIAVPPETALLVPDYLVPALDAEVLSYFVPEAQEYLEAL